MRPNVKVEMTDRGLHEALGTKQFYEGKVIDHVNLWAWIMVVVFVVSFWSVAWYLIHTAKKEVVSCVPNARLAC